MVDFDESRGVQRPKSIPSPVEKARPRERLPEHSPVKRRFSGLSDLERAALISALHLYTRPSRRALKPSGLEHEAGKAALKMLSELEGIKH
jgi:hypothetical protein